ncbi:hypothetical protein [Aquitalea sp. ASV15]|uniref:hypothetical protein n=1 Tax=Aquitalea sp. ASV15 TaxID=2795104 RepID=UPI0018EC52E1|nr:hypothetical protein [Aquitalea sp. ASV15]
MRRIMLAIGVGIGLAGCSEGSWFNTIPASNSVPYLPPSPPVAIVAAATREEVAFLQAGGCGNCREADRFYRFIHADPDVRKSRIPRNMALAEDANLAKKQWVDEVRTAVYFSKRIRLANGQSLFELITRCGKGWDSPATQATLDVPANSPPGFRLQYLISFKKFGQPIGLQMRALFMRRGEQLIANSAFAESLLQNPDFMRANGLRCWSD